jgi:transposase
VLADLALGKMRAKIGDLELALEGRFDDHHALMCQLHLDHIGHLDNMIAKLDAQVEAMMAPFRAERDHPDHHPRHRGAGRCRGHLRDRRQPG